MIQNRRKVFSIILYLISIFIHHFAVVIILVRLLTLIGKPILTMILSLGTSFVLEPIVRYIANNIDNEYIQFSCKRVLDTFEKMGYTTAVSSFSGSTLLIYACFIILSIYLFAISIKEKRRNEEDDYCKNVISFASTVGAVAIGLCFNYLYLERFMYLLSFALLMITPIHNHNEKGINEGNLILVPMALFVFFFNDIYIFIVNYTGNYFLAF